MPTIAPLSHRQRRLLEGLARGLVSWEEADRIARILSNFNTEGAA